MRHNVFLFGNATISYHHYAHFPDTNGNAIVLDLLSLLRGCFQIDVNLICPRPTRGNLAIMSGDYHPFAS